MPVVSPSRGDTLRVVPQQVLVSDYGTYTPVLSPGTGPDLTGNFSADYARVGRLVTVSMYLDINSIAGASGNLSILLPYRPITGANFKFLPIVYASTDPTDNDNAAAPVLVDCNGMFLRLTSTSNNGLVIVYRNHGTAGVAGANALGYQAFEVTADSIPANCIWYISGSYVTNGVKLV
jgi:hypothetical protein